jgi:class 3 adenylate cyclase
MVVRVAVPPLIEVQSFIGISLMIGIGGGDGGSLVDHHVDELPAARREVRPVEQGEGDSFVAAFAHAGDAVACALQLQRALLAPIRLRIGVHTGDIQLRDEGDYAGPTINRTARPRDLADGGQTVLSGATSEVVIDRLPVDAWLTDLGTHRAPPRRHSLRRRRGRPDRDLATASRGCPAWCRSPAAGW